MAFGTGFFAFFRRTGLFRVFFGLFLGLFGAFFGLLFLFGFFFGQLFFFDFQGGLFFFFFFGFSFFFGLGLFGFFLLQATMRRNHFGELCRALLQGFLQFPVDVLQGIDLGGDFGDGVFGGFAVFFFGVGTHLIEVRFDLAGGRPRQEFAAAVAAAGGQEQARRERGEEERGCSKATHDSSLKNTSESIFTLHLDACFA
ncbi:MAG: hypothetical protein J0H06_14505, partial [Actinobacteria bacterium]|nr:hypothetical protein [Actinomycetota bacterium]